MRPKYSHRRFSKYRGGFAGKMHLQEVQQEKKTHSHTDVEAKCDQRKRCKGHSLSAETKTITGGVTNTVIMSVTYMRLKAQYS